jgi:hypothetical protein
MRSILYENEQKMKQRKLDIFVNTYSNYINNLMFDGADQYI